MTIATTTNRVDAPGNGSATSFSFAPVVIFEAADLQVTVRNSSGIETVLAQGAGSANYSVSVASYPGTGAIVYPASGSTPLPTGSTIVIKRVVPLLQTVSLSNQGAYFPKIQEGEFDFLTAIDQQQQEQLGRTLQLAATDPAIPLLFPTSVTRANKFLAFDGNGLPIAGSPSGGVPISSAMQPFVASASLAAAGALMGIPLCITEFGALPDGSDCTNALLSALAALPVGGGTITIPVGTWTFSSLATFSYPSVLLFGLTLRGAGADSTILHWPSTDGLSFLLNQPGQSIHLLDMTIVTSSVGTKTGVRIHQSNALGAFAQNDFTRVTWRGFSIAAQTNCWGTAADITGLCNFNVVGCEIEGANISSVYTGNGFICQGSASITNQLSVIQNFTGCNFQFLATGIIYGDYIQGMSLSQCNFTAVATGIHQLPGSGGGVVGAQLALNNCQLACSKYDIEIEGVLDNISATGNLFYSSVANAASIFFTATSFSLRNTIVGNMFEGNNSAGSNAIVVAGSCGHSTISGNTAYGFTTAVAFLAGSVAASCAVLGNSITGIGTSNAGINLSGSNTFFTIVGNTFDHLGTGVILGATSGFNNVQSNTYASCVAATADTGTSNVIGGGSP